MLSKLVLSVLELDKGSFQSLNELCELNFQTTIDILMILIELRSLISLGD